jgi:hypothetical protein
LKKFEKIEKIGNHSDFNFECNTESGFKESLSIALGYLYNGNEVWGCFGQAELQRKNLPTPIFGVFFSTFCGQKKS